MPNPKKYNKIKAKLILWVAMALIIYQQEIHAQQFVNNGAVISITNNASLNLHGASMDFINVTNNTTHGDIDLAGKIYVQGNWTNDATGGMLLDSTASSGEVVFNGTSEQIISGRETHFYNLTVNANADVNVSPGNLIKIYNDFTNNGSFTLKTDDSKTASLIDAGAVSKLKGSGISTIERYVGKGGWHYISSPITKATSSTNYLWGSAMYTYDEATSAWVSKRANEELDVFTGYDVYFKNDNKTVSFTGTFNTGNFSKGLTKLGSGYNFIGNPYPCTIDWENPNGWTKTNVDDAVYIWDPALNGGLGDFIEYVNGIGNRGGSRFIPATQGFWVKCNSNSGGSIGINNEAKCNTVTTVFRTSEEQEFLRIKLEQNNYATETTIRMHMDATEAFDNHLDALKIIHESPSVPQLFTTSSDQKMLAINSIPEYFTSETVPMGLKTGADGNCKLTFELQNINDIYEVYLEDLVTNTIINLRQQAEYKTQISYQHDQNRFLIHFSQVGSIENDNLNSMNENINESSYVVYSNLNNIYIKNPGNGLYDLFVYDVLGQEIKNERKIRDGFKIISNISTGHYIVKILTKDQIISQQINIP